MVPLTQALQRDMESLPSLIHTQIDAQNVAPHPFAIEQVRRRCPRHLWLLRRPPAWAAPRLKATVPVDEQLGEGQDQRGTESECASLVWHTL